MLDPAAGRTLLSKTSIGGTSLATSSTNQKAKFDCDLILPDPLMSQDDETVNKLLLSYRDGLHGTLQSKVDLTGGILICQDHFG